VRRGTFEAAEIECHQPPHPSPKPSPLHPFPPWRARHPRIPPRKTRSSRWKRPWQQPGVSKKRGRVSLSSRPWRRAGSSAFDPAHLILTFLAVSFLTAPCFTLSSLAAFLLDVFAIAKRGCVVVVCVCKKKERQPSNLVEKGRTRRRWRGFVGANCERRARRRRPPRRR